MSWKDKWDSYEPGRSVEEYVYEFKVNPDNVEAAAQEVAQWWEDQGEEYMDAYYVYLEAFKDYFGLL